MVDQVEKVARALAVADGKDPDAPAWVEGYGPHERTFGLCWRDQYSEKAKAAIAVLTAYKPNKRLREALERVAELEELLKPFADVAYSYDKHAEILGTSSPYKDSREMRVSLGNCRKARAALTPPSDLSE